MHRLVAAGADHARGPPAHDEGHRQRRADALLGRLPEGVRPARVVVDHLGPAGLERAPDGALAAGPHAHVRLRAVGIAGEVDQEVALGHPPEQEGGVGAAELRGSFDRQPAQPFWLQDAAGCDGDLVQ